MNGRSVLTISRLIGLDLTVDGKELVYRAPKSTLTPGLLEALREFKAEVLNLLGESPITDHHLDRLDPSGGEVADLSEENVWGDPYAGFLCIGRCSVCGEDGRYLLPETRTHYCEEHLAQAGHDNEAWAALQATVQVERETVKRFALAQKQLRVE